MRVWRTLALLLLLVNIGLLVQRQLQPERPDSVGLPLLPDAPQATLVPQPLSHGLPGRPRCYTLGPLNGDARLAFARGRLEPFAEHIAVRTTQADRDLGWWVTLAPESGEAARALLDQLAEREVSGAFLVEQGALAGAISLGLFEDIQSARRRQARLQRLGFEARIKVRRERQPQHWIDYRLAPDQRSPWRAILRDSPGARHFAIACR
ncbi:MAG: hypothetical protein RQ729_05545 [Wenzhouxiangellaceae bacterium]|nr:hypothetical protein [Wenzhouxiangellaceae bacterium]